MHPDECRKFSIPELKRICSFPDDFVLTSSYRHQYERLGRAFPPKAMYEIAKNIQVNILDRIPKVP
jgi:DNA (cytosine-5)-methyltransferase 1